MPNLETVTPLLLTTAATAMLLIGLTGCPDDTKRTDQSKTDDKPNQQVDQVDEKSERLDKRSDRLEDKAERLELKADQERDAEQQRTDKMDKTDEGLVDEIEDKIDENR